MAGPRTINLQYPSGGVVRRFGYQQQPPFTTADALNARPEGTFESRERGGSRPMLRRVNQTPLPGVVRVITSMDVMPPPGPPHASFVDDFTQYNFGWPRGNPWTQRYEDLDSSPGFGSVQWDPAGFITSGWHPPGKAVFPMFALNDLSPGGEHLPIDMTFPVTVGLYITPTWENRPPWKVRHRATYFLWVGLTTDDSVFPYGVHTPGGIFQGRGVGAALGVGYGGSDEYPGNDEDTWSRGASEVFMFNNGSRSHLTNFADEPPGWEDREPAEGWWTLTIDEIGGQLFASSVYTGRQLLERAPLGLASELDGNVVGFGWMPTVPDPNWGLARMDAFKVDYAKEQAEGVPRGPQRISLALANENLWKRGADGEFAMASPETVDDVRFNNELKPTVAIHTQRLFIADFDGDYSTDNGFGLAQITSASSDYATMTFPELYQTLAAVDLLLSDIIQPDSTVGITGIDPVVSGTYIIIEAGPNYIRVPIAALGGRDFNGVTHDCSFHLYGAKAAQLRSPKVYDGTRDILENATPTAGEFPSACPLVANYRDRLVWAGDPPHQYYFSRQGDPLDYAIAVNQTGLELDPAAPVAGSLQQPITALAPHSEAYMVFGLLDGLELLRGDIGFGGRFTTKSKIIGIIGPRAWCWMPGGELLFLSRDGLYILPAGGGGFPQSVSRERLPRELENLDALVDDPLIVYDSISRGVYIYLTGNQLGRHWWFDWERKGFWPDTLAGAHNPSSVHYFESANTSDTGLLLGGADGIIRMYDRRGSTDDGMPTDSYVLYGPIRLSPGGYLGAMLEELIVVPSEVSNPVEWELLVGETPEQAYRAAPFATGVGAPGRNYSETLRAQGNTFYIKVKSKDGKSWAMQEIIARARTLGPQRRL